MVIGQELSLSGVWDTVEWDILLLSIGAGAS